MPSGGCLRALGEKLLSLLPRADGEHPMIRSTREHPNLGIARRAHGGGSCAAVEQRQFAKEGAARQLNAALLHSAVALRCAATTAARIPGLLEARAIAFDDELAAVHDVRGLAVFTLAVDDNFAFGHHL